MRSFEQIPRELLLDASIPVGARLMYPILRYLAWRNGREKDGDAVELPPLDEIAETLGVATSTAKAHLAALRSTGWVETQRGARNRPTRYVVHDAPREPKIGPPESRKSADRDVGSLLALDVNRRTAPTERSGDVPKLVRVDGRNLGFDALVEVCRIDPRGNRAREVATALNTGGPNLDFGIRELVWREARRRGVDPGEPFEQFLASAIHNHARAYRLAMRDAALTPFALAKWWTDVDRVRPEDAATRAARRAADLAEQGR